MPMNSTFRLLTVAIACALSLPIAGCGYSLAGRGAFLPEYIRTIAVPLFANLTAVPDVDRILTDRVMQEFIGRGRYKVVSERTSADAVLVGEITGISFVPAALTVQQQASRYVLVLTARIEFRDLKQDKVLWQNPAVQFREEFELTNTSSPDVTAFFGQDADALRRVATEFARTIVSAILEAF
jgi:hypothetical protein